MTPHLTKSNVTFRSKQEREREAHLLGNYRKIGIAAIAAAAANLSLPAKRKKPSLATRSQPANRNGRD
ncbi:hypothetical protein [Aureimonas sp. AU4]|uniref:hypothetical protein n=1 Tax=Aureimonas sp. AU4 TaxID=1638163 RepID=UPI000783E4A1|nr:hypothetical protein [Aureimonas sp. AU4]